MPKLTLFYDGHCPLCVREMRHLTRLDRAQNMQLVDIQREDFSEHWPQVNKAEASSILLAVQDNGEWLRGLDVTHRAWQLVGKGYWIAPLRWPVIRLLADQVYLWFARNRYRISGWLTGQQRCEACAINGCDIADKKPGVKKDK